MTITYYVAGSQHMPYGVHSANDWSLDASLLSLSDCVWIVPGTAIE